MSAQEERGILIVVSPLIGDTVYAQQEAIYHLFPDVDGFRWAKYYMLPDSEVYAIVNYIPFASDTDRSAREEMGSLAVLRDKIKKIHDAEPPEKTIEIYDENHPLPHTEKFTPQNTLYVEFLGNGGLYSLNYDHRFSNKVSLRAGISYYSVNNIFNIFLTSGTFTVLNFPVQVNYLFNFGSSNIQVGAGITVWSENDNYAYNENFIFGPVIHTDTSYLTLFFNPTIGYRYQPKDGGFFFQASIMSLIDPFNSSDKNQLPFWFGIGLGITY